MPITDVVEVVNKMCLSELIVLNELVAANIGISGCIPHVTEVIKYLNGEGDARVKE